GSSKARGWREGARAFGEGLDAQAVLAVKESGNQEPAEPAQLASFLDLLDLGLERHRASVRRSDTDLEASTLLQRPGDSLDEGVPLRIGGEVSQESPDALGRSVDLDLAAEHPHDEVIPSNRYARNRPDRLSGHSPRARASG